MLDTHATTPVAQATPAQRAAFVRQTFLVFACALVGFLFVEALVLKMGLLDSLNELELMKMVNNVVELFPRGTPLRGWKTKRRIAAWTTEPIFTAGMK